MNIHQLKEHVFPERVIVPEERLSVVNFARAIGATDKALYRTSAAQQAGYDGRPVPPALLTFVLTLDERDLIDTIGIDYGRTLFGGVEFEFGEVATERDELIGQSRVRQAYERAGSDGVTRQFLVLTTEFKNERGALVSRSHVTFIERLTT